MISCRINFYEAYVREGALSERIDLDLIVSKWSEDKVIEYIKKIFSENEKKSRSYICN